jgi:hypothetical protein
MSERGLPELDREALAVLDAERNRGDVAPELADAIYRRVVVPLPPTGGTRAPAPVAGGKPLALPVWAVPAAFVVGGALGGALHAALAPPQVVYVDRVVEMAPPASTVAAQPSPATGGPAVVAATGSARAPADTAPAVPSSPAPSTSAAISTTTTAAARPPPTTASGSAPAASASGAGRTDSLARERALLEVARTAFGRSDAQATLEALDRHRAEFPDGKLAEEREALAIEALVEAGRIPEARARGAQFRARYPKSILMQAVDDALKPAP